MSEIQEEDWNRVLLYCLVRYPTGTQALVKAKAFSDGIKELQSLAGHSQEQFDKIQQGLLAMVREEN